MGGIKGQALRFSVVVVIALVVLFPIYWMLVTSVLPSDRVLSVSPPLVPSPRDFRFQAYADVVLRKPIFKWFVNSLIVTVGSACGSVIVSTLAGYSLSRFHTTGQQLLGYVLLLSRMLPGSLLVIPMYIIFSDLKMINTLGVLVLANVSAIVPFSTWMMKGFFDGISMELEESALMDGCSWPTTFGWIVLPLTLPGLGAVTIYASILCWNEYLFARTLAYDPDRWIFTVGVASFVGEHTVNWASLMASGMIFIIPIVVLFFFLEPFLVSGLTAGAVKE
jgi:multiple sugar transport system permease protein